MSTKASKVEMPLRYTDHALCAQLKLLSEEDSLHDIDVVFKSSGKALNTNSFLLSLVSPVFHRMVCGAFKESASKRLELEEVDPNDFTKVLELSCGKSANITGGLEELLALGILADQFQITEVRSAVENEIVRNITIDSCAQLLNDATSWGLSCVAAASRMLALEQFESFSRTPGFMSLREDVLESLLEDDRLVAASEEAVFESLASWMRGGEDGILRGCSLLEKVRFPLMDAEYLVTKAMGAASVPASFGPRAAQADRDAAMGPSSPRAATDALVVSGARAAEYLSFRVALEGLVHEASRVKCMAHAHIANGAAACGSGTAGTGDWLTSLHRLGPKALAPRIRRGVAWSQYVDAGGGGGRSGREIRLRGHRADVGALMACRGRVCSGSDDGSIRVWDAATLRHERTLTAVPAHARDGQAAAMIAGAAGGDEEGGREVFSLTVWDGWLLSGSRGGRIRVWDVCSGQCQQVLVAHGAAVNSLATCGARLLSASDDGTVGVWRLRAMWGHLAYKQRWGPMCEVETAAEWRLEGHTDRVLVVAGYCAGGSGATEIGVSGSVDGTVRVWDVISGRETHTLKGHGSWVNVLAIVEARRQLVSSSADGGLRLWALGTWECLRAVKAAVDQPVRCLAVSGCKLVGGVEPPGGAAAVAEGGEGAEWRLIVWDLDTLDTVCNVRGKSSDGGGSGCGAVWQLLSVDGAVWGAVGQDLVVWGREV